MSVKARNRELSSAAMEIFQKSLRAVNPANAVRNFVHYDGARSLLIGDAEFDLNRYKKIYSVAFGKAAFPMAESLSAALGEKLMGGVISCAATGKKLPDVWRVFHGGHPLPNEDSLAAALAAMKLLDEANAPDSLVIFLVSGGGSAMMELPATDSISLGDLQEANRVLVNCGATISEINSVRRSFSRVKGGGLFRAAIKAAQVSLIVSDTNDGESKTVASGATFPAADDETEFVRDVLELYKLFEVLPRSINLALSEVKTITPTPDFTNFTKRHFVLLDNSRAVETAVQTALEFGFEVERANDLVESPIEAGCKELIKRLLDLQDRTRSEKPVAVISGGEFVCPVRGEGVGGRNLESALRTAILFDELRQQLRFGKTKFAALFAGTDGIDGNSPAAGAIADEMTVSCARLLNLNPEYFLANSDSYNFFRALSQQIEIGATGTNVRDLRILLMN